MTQVVTELILDASGATSGSAQYEQAMARAEAAHAKAAAAIDKQMKIITAGVTGSSDRLAAGYAKLEASIDPISAAGHKMARELMRAQALVDASVLRGLTTQVEADATIARLRERQIADVARLVQAQQKLNDTPPLPVNDNVPGRGRFNTSNLAAQGFDIATTAGFMPFYTVMLQQGPQVAQVFNDIRESGQAIGPAVAGAFAQILSPLSLMTMGVVGLVAIMIQFVEWPKAAAAALDFLADSLETIAPYAAIAAAGLALLYAPAIITGIVSVIAMLGRLTVAAGIAAAAMATANPGIALVAGFTIAVAAANIFRDELTKILGFDIVDAAKKGGNLVIGALVGGFEYIKTIWNNLPAIVASATLNAANAAVNGIEKMINAATDLLDAMIVKINAGLSKLPGGFEIGTIGDIDLPDIPNNIQKQSDAAFGDANAAMQSAMNRDYLGEFGTAIANGASAASEKLSELADWMTKVDEKGKKRHGKTDAEKYDDIVNGAERRIASLQAEYDALGLTEHASAKLAYETDLLNEAQQKGIALTADQRAELSNLADTMATIEIATKRAREAMDFAKELTTGFFEDFRSGIEQGKSIWESFADAALNALDRIADRLIDMAMDQLITSLLSGLLGGMGGGWNYKWLASTGGYLMDSGGVHMGSNVIPFGPNTKAFGNGVLADSGLGPRHFPAVLEEGESVLTARMMSRTMGTIAGLAGAQNAGNSQPSSYNDNRTFNIDARGAQKGVGEEIKAALAEYDKGIPDKIDAYQRAPRRRVA